jgi:dihydropteroate synthase
LFIVSIFAGAQKYFIWLMYTLNCKGKLLVMDKPLIMGIINATPDSFVEGHLNKGMEAITTLASKMIGDGTDILDIGGQSTRPGSSRVTAKEEIARVVPVIKAIRQVHADVIISIDTYQSKVASAAVAAGASIVNDISGGNMDVEMLATVGALHVPYICMHMKGTPATMHLQPQYENITIEVIDFFIERIAACRQAGIADIIIDPGFGFGKNIQHNFQLLKNLSAFKILDLPLLAGLSRKSTIYKTLNTDAAHALNGTTVLNTIALMNGAAILRVHDVKEAKEAATLFENYRNR